MKLRLNNCKPVKILFSHYLFKGVQKFENLSKNKILSLWRIPSHNFTEMNNVVSGVLGVILLINWHWGWFKMKISMSRQTIDLVQNQFLILFSMLENGSMLLNVEKFNFFYMFLSFLVSTVRIYKTHFKIMANDCINIFWRWIHISRPFCHVQLKWKFEFSKLHMWVFL